ncbi:hypothetical protein [Intrasporangium calvum]|uniref:hypothetical protein n=1 Tax=Intrasporangium calvum TaxID=53358 RepID=UPI00059C9BFA|nr:hypothetical protein [Intrasporangium calvum]
MNIVLRAGVSIVASALIASGLVVPAARTSAEAAPTAAASVGAASAPTWQPPAPPRDTVLNAGAVPRGGVLAAGKDAPKAKRVRELPGRRSANGKVFELSDGRLEHGPGEPDHHRHP